MNVIEMWLHRVNDAVPVKFSGPGSGSADPIFEDLDPDPDPRSIKEMSILR